MSTRQQELVGRGNREGAALFRDWFVKLDNTAKTGGLSAYVFVMGSLNEILKTFDLHLGSGALDHGFRDIGGDDIHAPLREMNRFSSHPTTDLQDAHLGGKGLL